MENQTIKEKSKNVKPDDFYSKFHPDFDQYELQEEKQFDSLVDMISSINENWNNNQNLSSDIIRKIWEFRKYNFNVYWFLYENNSIESNNQILDHLKEKISELYQIKQIKDYVFEFLNKLKLLEECIPDNLITSQLYFLTDYLVNIKRDLEIIKNANKLILTFSDINFSDFQFTDEEIFNLIRKNEKWHDIKRDLEIYQERQKGIYLDTLGNKFGLKVSATSLAIKKVRGSINYWKGKLFEDFVEKKLKDSNLFEKVIKEAGKGEADILAYTKDNRLFIYSLKNLKIKRKPYWLTKDELRPELERALLQSLDYEVNLILLIFDNYHDIVKQYQIDFHNPENINLSGDDNTTF